MSEPLEPGVRKSPFPAVDFSVVIPTFGRPDSAERLLESLTKLNYPRERFEVIIVDDGSPNPAQPRLARFQQTLDLIALRQDNAGPSKARNRGAAVARGKYLAFTDDDCTADPFWLRALANALERTGPAVCGGRTINGLPGDIYAEATQILADYLYQRYNPTSTPGAFYPTNNFAVPRDAFLEVGGFDESMRFGEDREFCYRWASRGLGFISVADAIIYHAHSLDFCSFLRLHFCYGAGTYNFRRISSQAGLKRVKVSSPVWYLRLVLAGIAKHKNVRGLALTALLAATQAASAAGLVWGMIRSRGAKPRTKGRPRRSTDRFESYSPDRT
jgi:GT2 family glycosyltransferase